MENETSPLMIVIMGLIVILIAGISAQIEMASPQNASFAEVFDLIELF